jgi:proline iminopeptidase
MGRALATIVTALFLFATQGCGQPVSSPLYEPIEPLHSGYLSVSDLHELYWEVVGNPRGIPVVVLHGGPGGSAHPEMRRLFDPERFYVLLFDQRGAYRSKPRGEWRENRTQHLIDDINRLRKHVGIEGQAILFGGSWGSTLALAYAERHPDLVAGMVLRGVFLATQAEIDYFYHGGTAKFFPDNWERLRGVVPEPDTSDYPRQLFEMMTGEDPNERETAIEGWAYYEIRMSSVSLTDEATEDIVERYKDHLMPFSVLENYYMMNGCFLEDGQLLRDVDRIVHIPTFIVQGRFDVVCPPSAAWELARRLDNVNLELTAASGHSQNEPANRKALIRGVEWVAERIELEPPADDRQINPVAPTMEFTE